jgi:outer membrane immunogenic protein
LQRGRFLAAARRQASPAGLANRGMRATKQPGTPEKSMRGVVIAAMAASIASNALAADYSRAPYVVSPPTNNSWMGPYLGLNLGYDWGRATHSGANPSGLSVGLQGGYNWQTGHFVYGLEGDIQATNADDTFANFKFSNPWFGTMRGRAGVTINNILLFGTLGFALGGGRVEIPGLSESNTHFGWAAGGGMEVGFAPNWTAKAEYLYVDLSSQSYVLTGTGNGFQNNILRFGVNYHF